MKRIALPLFAFVVLLAACSSGGAPAPSVTPTATTAATPTAAVTDAPAEPTHELTPGAPFSLSPGTTLYATRNCPFIICGAEAPAWSAYKLQVEDTGQIVSTSLLGPLTAVVEQDVERPISEIYGPGILDVHVRPDGSEILVEVCVTDRCGDKCYKASKGVDEDDRINVYSSRDDGLTWSVSMTLVPYDYVMGIWDDDRIVVGNCRDKTAWLVPGNDPIPYPSDTTPSLATGGGATRFADGSVVYRDEYPTDQYLVRESPDGSILERFKIPQSNASGVRFGPRLSDSEQVIMIDGRLFVIDWNDYELHRIENDSTDPDRLTIVGIRQN